MKNLFLAAIACFVFCCSCNNDKTATATTSTTTVTGGLLPMPASATPKQLLCQNWQLSTDVADGILTSSSESNLEIPFHGYSFFEDGQVVQNPRDNMKTGKWLFEESAKKITIVFADNTKKEGLIKNITAANLQVKWGADTVVNYIGDGKQRVVVAADPFYPANNLWRVKPTRSETDSFIKKRVINCVLFYQKFFADNADRAAPSISFYGLPTCFKWYSGGISLINQDKLGQKWMNCFYNKAQAIQGQQLVDKVISKKYQWNKKESRWVKQSADVLLQMTDSLRKL